MRFRFKTSYTIVPEGPRLSIRAYAPTVPRAEAGRILVDRNGRVTWVHVAERYRGQHLGTQLYERAAQAACEKLGVGLRSDKERSAMSHGFWKKQETKGRARCIQKCTPADEGDPYCVVGRGGCLQYELAPGCPPPASLLGVRKRKRR